MFTVVMMYIYKRGHCSVVFHNQQKRTKITEDSIAKDIREMSLISLSFFCF